MVSLYMFPASHDRTPDPKIQYTHACARRRLTEDLAAAGPDPRPPAQDLLDHINATLLRQQERDELIREADLWEEEDYAGGWLGRE